MDQDAIFAALHDRTSREILAQTSTTDRSAGELADLIDVSETTVYRRLETLKEHGLVHESIRVEKDGNHRRVYRATVKHIEVDITNEEVTTRVEWDEDAADRFTRLWEGLRGDE